MINLAVVDGANARTLVSREQFIIRAAKEIVRSELSRRCPRHQLEILLTRLRSHRVRLRLRLPVSAWLIPGNLVQAW